MLLIARCRVSYTDADDLTHAIDVEAESLYEAVALAVAEFRQKRSAAYRINSADCVRKGTIIRTRTSALRVEGSSRGRWPLQT